MDIKTHKFQIVMLLVLNITLCQCTKAVNTSPQPELFVNKQIASPYTLPASTYLAIAKKQPKEQKQALLLAAAGRLLFDGQWLQSAAILAQTSGLTAKEENEKNLLLAKIDLIKASPQTALVKLGAIDATYGFSAYHTLQYHELLAQAYNTQGHYIESVLERIKLDALLADKSSLQNNRRMLWFTLVHIPTGDLRALAEENPKKQNLQGWLQLALISRQYSNNTQSLLAALDQWQSQFAHHPANQLLPEPLDSISEKIVHHPKQIALLLPITGTLSGPGNAIREGFMNAYKTNHTEQTTLIKVYDTNKEDITALYQKAVAEGANYVVGPLTKEEVNKVAALSHPVPTLLLNDSEVSPQENSYLFGLSPTHEASQAALKASNQGHRNALIIAPQNNWGDEVSKAFAEELQLHHGKIVDTLFYTAKDDLNNKIRDFLQINESQAREKQIKELLGNKVESLLSRRQDFDMIFLLAYPSKARQIMPLLRYYYVGDVPVYATSSVYGGNANALKDKDLDGIIFCDIPWVFGHQMGTRNWPEQFNSYNRLYALGMDSYALTHQLNQLILFPGYASNQANAILYLKPSQQVARVLEWGQFKQGLVQSLGQA